MPDAAASSTSRAYNLVSLHGEDLNELRPELYWTVVDSRREEALEKVVRAARSLDQLSYLKCPCNASYTCLIHQALAELDALSTPDSDG